MREKEAREWLEKKLLLAKGDNSPDEYWHGIKDGVDSFINFLIQQGVLKR